ncbi:flagellar biosynthetic protein FlhB [Litorimonas taeanensis]|uniref:Flagellar biosynthetic protein FlhB n=1 Tax=Litorimonas taeanensis TaxID=568099 RepID=A0A420WMA4_9PROT|nr:flagellar type III secretion system protein FlhB [Litorimonas taeanensis]RKQ72137.1 flagellar biosynthetic protein FlhB [Litorimonas taeanensis]
MSDNEQSGAEEKSFDASETKIRKSREQGDTPQSMEANTLFLYAGLLIAILIFGKAVAFDTLLSLSGMLEHPEAIGANLLLGEKSRAGGNDASDLLWSPILAFAPLFLLLIMAVLSSLVLQRAIVFAPSKLKPKLSKLSPISNAKQKYGPNGMFEFGKRFFKLCFIAVIGGIFFYNLIVTLPGESAIPTNLIVPEMYRVALQLIFYMVLAVALITIIDLPYMQFSHLKKLRMTLKEVRDESKDSEGDPHMKAARRSRAIALSQNSMLNDVLAADVIIVNPTHYAVAIKWDRESQSVPILLAKGVDELAFRIRQRAKQNDIPIHSDPPCARSIYAGVEIGEPIKPEHYAAVAASIHFADSLKPAEY